MLSQQGHEIFTARKQENRNEEYYLFHILLFFSRAADGTTVTKKKTGTVVYEVFAVHTSKKTHLSQTIQWIRETVKLLYVLTNVYPSTHEFVCVNK